MREDIAWAAGFFEGEGCFYLHKQRPRLDGSCLAIAAASLVQKDRDLLEKFAHVVGMGSIGSGNDRGVYSWKVCNHERVQALLAMLWPWLSPRRRGRATECLLIDRGQPRNVPKQNCQAGHPYNAVNTLFRSDGTRICRPCRAAYAKKFRARVKANQEVSR